MKNSFFKSSLTFGLGFVFLRGISFLLLPIHTNFLSTFDAGIVFIIYSILAFLNPVYALGMDSALFKFFNSKKHSQQEIISSSLIFSIIFSTILSGTLCILSLFCSNIFNITYNWLWLIALILFFDSISSRLLILLRLFDRPRYYLCVGLINILSSLFFNLLFIQACSLGDRGALYALLSTAIIQFIALFPLFFYYINLKHFNFNLCKKMLLFGLPFLPSALLFILTSVVDRFFIEHFLDLNAVGVYGAGYKIGSLVSIVVIAFNLAWQPYYLKYFQSADFINNIKLISRNFSIILLYIATGITVWSDSIIKVQFFNVYIIGVDFWAAVSIVPWIAFSYFFYGLFILQIPTIYIHNKQNWSPLFWGAGATTNILLNYFLVPLFGINGAAIATLVSFLIMFMFIKYKNQSWMPINFVNKKLIFCFLLSGITIYLFHFSNMKPLLLACVFVVYSGISATCLIVNKSISK